ncbi:hypothetical protein SGPA1_40643 [Streptomyces misionensis JCM 4497]
MRQRARGGGRRGHSRTPGRAPAARHRHPCDQPPAATDNHPGLRGCRLPAAPDAEAAARLHRRRFGRRAVGFLRLAARDALSLRAVGGLLRARPAQPVPLAVPRELPDLLPAFVGDFAPHRVHTGHCASRCAASRCAWRRRASRS